MVTIDQHAAQHLLVFDPIRVKALSLRSGNLYLPMAIWGLALEEVTHVRP